MKIILIFILTIISSLCQAQIQEGTMFICSTREYYRLCGGTEQQIFSLDIINGTDSVVDLRSLGILLQDSQGVVESLSLYQKDSSLHFLETGVFIQKIGATDSGFSYIGKLKPNQNIRYAIMVKVVHGKQGNFSISLRNYQYMLGTQHVFDTAVGCTENFIVKGVEVGLSAENFSDTLTRIQLDTTNLLEWIWSDSSSSHLRYDPYLYLKPDAYVELTLHTDGCSERIKLYTESHLYFTAWWYLD